MSRVLVASQVNPQFGFALLPADWVFSQKAVVFCIGSYSAFCAMQCRVHESWVRFFSSTLKDDLNYSPSDCFANFPFPVHFETNATLENVGEAYHGYRAALMIRQNQGLTKTYNRFHARGENGADITRLRALHAEMDATVLRAYGWDDLADRVAPEFIEQDADEGKSPNTRLDWPADFKDEVLARLLALNAERAAAERAAGLTTEAPEDELVDGEEVD